MTDIRLTEAQLSVLDLGLTFIPAYRHQPLNDIYKFQDRLIRNLKLKDYFGEKDPDEDDFDYTVKTFTDPSTWIPPDKKLSADTLQTVHDIAMMTENILKQHTIVDGKGALLSAYKDNLTADQRTAIQQLRNNADIVIKPADKGSATVVMHKWAYAAEARRQLNNQKYYRKLTRPLGDKLTLINAELMDMMQHGYISESQRRHLEARPTDRDRVFYLLPKIHKPREKWPQQDVMPEGRPIVSDTGSESYRVAAWINHFLRPISMRHSSYIKDTYDFVHKIRHRHVPGGAILVTGDVTALYTNMDINRSLQVVQRALAKYPDKERPDTHILRLLETTLKNNDFVFDGERYLQTCGTAMGKSYAPALADLYMEEFDAGATADTSVHAFFRFLDDIFFIWTGSEEQLQLHGTKLNGLIPDIAVTLNWSATTVDFLDTTVYVENSSLLTRVHFKSTDTHQLLHTASFHPRHTCRGVLKSQLIRFRRISSSRRDYDAACSVLFPVLRKRNYGRRMMRKMKADIWNMKDGDVLQLNKRKTNREILPMVVPYNEIGTTLTVAWRRIISRNNIFDNFRLISAYTAARNIKSRLVRSSFTESPTVIAPTNASTTDQRNGCFRCDSNRCRACNYVTETNSFRSTTNGTVFQVRGNVTCKTTHVVYLITCRYCNLQYVGETSRSLADRINDHLSCIRTGKQTPIALHFNSAHHSSADFTINGIEIVNDGANTATTLLMKERTWQNLLQTVHPLGINGLKGS